MVPSVETSLRTSSGCDDDAVGQAARSVRQVGHAEKSVTPRRWIQRKIWRRVKARRAERYEKRFELGQLQSGRSSNGRACGGSLVISWHF